MMKIAGIGYCLRKLTLHGDNVLPTGDHPCHLEGCFDGLGTRVPQEERIKRRVRHNWEEFLDEAQVRPVECDATLKESRSEFICNK